MSVRSGKIPLSTNERRTQMSANVYTIESLLVGKMYRSKTLTGEIISAEKDNSVWYADCDTYLVEVRPLYSAPLNLKDTYRYLAVKTSD
jgi:hypothetical protein